MEISPQELVDAKLRIAIQSGDILSFYDIISSHPEALGRVGVVSKSWLHYAAAHGQLQIIEHLLDGGFDVNLAVNIEQTTALDSAVHAIDVPHRSDVIRLLLARRADPNLSRPLLSAINPRHGTEDICLELVRLLVEAGADINREYDIYGNADHTFTALEFAEGHGRHQIAAYLRSKGAVDRPPRPFPFATPKGKRK